MMKNRIVMAPVLSCLVFLGVLAANLNADPLAAPIAGESARALLHRLLPGHEDRFVFEQIPPEEGQDLFEIESRGATIVIRGNSGVSMAMGLNWYLKHHCHCHVSLCGSQLDLPDPLPEVTPKVRRVCWARYRYFLNYCCFGYSLAWWDWDQWERLIDWMALNGINAPLSVTGQEAVWQAVCRKLDLTDEEITAFLAAPMRKARRAGRVRPICPSDGWGVSTGGEGRCRNRGSPATRRSRNRFSPASARWE